MPTLAQIRDAVDTKLATLWGVIQTRQDTYAANHNGRYWQGLITHNVTPADGVEVVPTIGLTCPTDQQGEPYPLAIRTSPLPMALRIDVYDGPDGTGYVATVQVTVQGKTYERAAQVGPETWRQYGWRQAAASPFAAVQAMVEPEAATPAPQAVERNAQRAIPWRFVLLTAASAAVEAAAIIWWWFR